MVQLRLVSESDVPLGAISWYPVHPTSMNNTNRLVSSDNIGYASVLMEKMFEPGSHPGKVSRSLIIYYLTNKFIEFNEFIIIRSVYINRAFF